MKRTEFEDILILETPYYNKFQKMYRETLNFKRYLTMLKRYVRHTGFIKMLEQKGGKELVYLGRTVFSLQEDFVKNYLDYLLDESDSNKWEQFFERYNKKLFGIWEKFVGGDNNKALIFEIINRKLLRDVITKETINDSFEKKGLVSERLGIVVNQIFTYMRNTLAKTMSIDDTLIIESYERIPLLPKCRSFEMAKLLSKQFLEKGLPEPIFTTFFKNITTSYYTAAKDKILSAISEKRMLSKNGISEILSSHFFFPDEATLAEILELLQVKARETVLQVKEKRETVEQRMHEIKKKTREITRTFNENLATLTDNFSSEESIDNALKKLRRILITNGYDLKILKGNYQKYFEAQHELNSIMGFKPHDLSKFILKNEWDPFVLLVLNKNTKMDDEKLQLLVKDVIGEIKNNKATMKVMNSYRTGGFLQERYKTDVIYEKFQLVIEDIIIPLVKSFLLEELIEYYPKLSGVTTTEGVRYLAEEAIAGKISMIEKDIHPTCEIKSISKLNIMRYKNLISVLVYDIRGSTFMGTKLKDAKKENEIRNLFQESMLAIVEKYGGIPIKDTGDGGIAIFTTNHYDIKHQRTLEPEPGSTLSAVRSAIDMVREAKKFVQDNIKKYQNWFKEAEERIIDFEGATYATLPPSYRSIFQIGIGISSGIYPKEVYLDKNAFGELDVTGMLVREANFYSTAKTKEKSIIICDDATLYNLLLNVEKFSFLSEEGLRIDPMLLNTEQGLEYWINQKTMRQGFILDIYKIFVKQVGEGVTHPDSLKIVLGDRDIVIDETGQVTDKKGGRGKFLFEIFSEEKR